MSGFVRIVPVRFAHCDPAGIVFYPQFFALVNEMVEDWFAYPLGCSFRKLHIEQGKAIPTARFEANFLSPCRLGDELNQRLAVSYLGRTSCRLAHTATVMGEVKARFVQTLVFVDGHTMKPEPWPERLREKMAEYAEAPQ